MPRYNDVLKCQFLFFLRFINATYCPLIFSKSIIFLLSLYFPLTLSSFSLPLPFNIFLQIHLLLIFVFQHLNISFFYSFFFLIPFTQLIFLTLSLLILHRHLHAIVWLYNPHNPMQCFRTVSR